MGDTAEIYELTLPTGQERSRHTSPVLKEKSTWSAVQVGMMEDGPAWHGKAMHLSPVSLKHCTECQRVACIGFFIAVSIRELSDTYSHTLQ